MKAAKFFRYAGKWRLKEIGKEVADEISIPMLEKYLGVSGGPLTYVCRETEQPEMPKLRIEIRNGFITRASLALHDDVPFKEGEEVEQFFVRPVN